MSAIRCLYLFLYIPALVERVFVRIGSAETDDVLQAELLKFLQPLILKLASNHEAVRKKVILF